ncbi:MAG: ferritin-like domain-containing protein [Cyanobacteria bacterium CRU_2_1]|nr:ferritin-like domain-containing protein [Cyanobacteria bacterium RU_5_0]NJR57792.1 ferritin-like domain-containing protein [Cyanobacteria bacterium CRU_2_1]
MKSEDFPVIHVPSRSKAVSRRGVLIGGAIAGLSGAIGLSAVRPARAQSPEDVVNDIEILNGALYYEHQAIWAYQTAAGFLSDTDVGRAVLGIAGQNMNDHMAHRDALTAAVQSLGGTPATAESEYDLSSYIERGEGNLDSDVNIAKLALALETDAAIAYTTEVARLKTPALITAGASIGTAESAHATAIRAAFIALGEDIRYVPASFVSADTRNDWVLKV